MSKTPEFRPTNEDLLGYVLGALDPEDHRRVQAYIDSKPEIQAELDRIRACLAPLEAVNIPAEPPGGLALRTCNWVFSQHERGSISRNPVSPHRNESRRNEFGGDSILRDAWQIWDLTMVAAVIVLMAMLLTPAVFHARESARRLACASNFRELGINFRQFSENHGGRFPLVHTSGNTAVAGSFVFPLRDAGLLPNPCILLCPASESAAFVEPFDIPTVEEMDRMDEERLHWVQRRLSGSVGYHVGEYFRGLLIARQDRSCEFMAIAADAAEHGRGLAYLSTHPGNGRNVLFESCSVKYVRRVVDSVRDMDDIFHNAYQRFAAGIHPEDSVIAESGASIPYMLVATPEFPDDYPDSE